MTKSLCGTSSIYIYITMIPYAEPNKCIRYEFNVYQTRLTVFNVIRKFTFIQTNYVCLQNSWTAIRKAMREKMTSLK